MYFSVFCHFALKFSGQGKHFKNVTLDFQKNSYSFSYSKGVRSGRVEGETTYYYI